MLFSKKTKQFILSQTMKGQKKEKAAQTKAKSTF